MTPMIVPVSKSAEWKFHGTVTSMAERQQQLMVANSG